MITQERLEYKHIAGAATTLVKSGQAFLHTLTVNTATGTITVYDGLTAAGAVVAVIAATVTGSLRYDIKCATGICIVTAGAADLTVSFG